MACKRLRELLKRKSSILRAIVPGHEKLDLLSRRVHSDLIQPLSDVMNSDISNPALIENIEGIEKIEVTFVR